MARKLNVLILEDTQSDLDLTLYLLKQAGFDPAWRNAVTPEAYLAALKDPPDVILADYTLPRFNAIEALVMLKEQRLNIPFIVVSGTISEEIAVRCMKLGASDYLLKDRLTRLGPAIEQALEQKKLRDEQQQAQAQLRLLSTAVEQSTEGIAVTDLKGNLLFVNQALADMHGYTREDLEGRHVSLFYTREQYNLVELAHDRVVEFGEYTGEIQRLVRDKTTFPSLTHISLLRDGLGKPIGMVRSVRNITQQKRSEAQIQQLLLDLQSSNVELSEAYDATLAGWVRFLDLRDHATEGHSQRVTDLTLALAARIDFPEKDRIHLRRGALLHDIGKMGIPDSILQKPGPLTEAEWEIMRQHPKYAFQMLSPIDFLRPALDIPHHHHERWDGTGYPDRLAGEEIPLAARLFAIVDVWDALNSDRPYRSAWPVERVIDHIHNHTGRHFDPHIAGVFMDYIQTEG